MAGRKTDEMKKRLLEERDALLRQRDAIDNQITGLERAIALVGGEEGTSATASGKRNSSLKAIVLDLLEEVGTTGLNSISAVTLANNRGMTIDRASVSSLLSRLKKDGVVVYNGDRYRLPKFAPSPGKEGKSQEDLLARSDITQLPTAVRRALE